MGCSYCAYPIFSQVFTICCINVNIHSDCYQIANATGVSPQLSYSELDMGLYDCSVECAKYTVCQYFTHTVSECRIHFDSGVTIPWTVTSSSDENLTVSSQTQIDTASRRSLYVCKHVYYKPSPPPHPSPPPSPPPVPSPPLYPDGSFALQLTNFDTLLISQLNIDHNFAPFGQTTHTVKFQISCSTLLNQLYNYYYFAFVLLLSNSADQIIGYSAVPAFTYSSSIPEIVVTNLREIPVSFKYELLRITPTTPSVAPSPPFPWACHECIFVGKYRY